MRIVKGISTLMLAITLFAAWTGVSLANSEEQKVQEAADVLAKIMQMPEKGIPPVLLRDARAVAVIPGVIKAAFVVGGRHGTGVLSTRAEDGRWSDPVFVSITGGSVGWQVGASSTDLVLVFKKMDDVEKLLNGKFTLGADAAVAAGPVGRKASAATDVRLRSGILSYSRSRGLFAGVSLDGAALLIDDDANAAYYGKSNLSAADILAGKAGEKPAATQNLKQALENYSKMK